MNTPKYFDYAATTPADARVIEAMCGCLGYTGAFGNPASTSHAVGMQAKELVERARAQVASLVNAKPDEIVWTSGATESNNLALKGFAELAPGSHLITSTIEHKAILDTAASLERRGMQVSYLSPDAAGRITRDAVAAAMRETTGLVSLMLVNNELGTLTDIASISRMVHEAGALLHVDAAQALGKTPIDVRAMGIDLMSMSAHKVYGPKGIGALYVNSSAANRLACQMHGGGHEKGLRSGTLATHQIVGMGAACEIARTEMDADNKRISALSERLVASLLATGAVTHNAAAASRIAHTISLTIDLPAFFPFMLTDELAISSTSACNSAAGAPSHVLTAIGLDEERAGQTVRLSLGRYTTSEDVDSAIECFQRVLLECSAFGSAPASANA